MTVLITALVVLGSVSAHLLVKVAIYNSYLDGQSHAVEMHDTMTEQEFDMWTRTEGIVQ